MHRSIMKILFLAISIMTFSCAQPIIIRNLVIDQPGIMQYGNNTERSFYVDKSISEFIELKWNKETHGSQSNTSVIIYDKYLFVTDLSGRLFVYDRLNGNLIGYEKFSGSINVAPVIINTKAYIAVNQLEEKYATIYLFNLINGKVQSEINIDGSINSEILKTEDGIILISSYGEIVKLNSVGMLLWTYKTNAGVKSNPALHGNVLVFGNRLGESIGFDISKQKILFKVNCKSSIESGFTINSNLVYFADIVGNQYCSDLSTGKILWSFSTGSKILSTAVINKDNLYIGNLSGTIFSFDKISGKLNWKLNTGGIINTTPILFNNYLIQPDYSKKVHFIDVKSGQLINSINYERRVKLTPIYYDGMLYIGSDRGQINAYKVFENN